MTHVSRTPALVSLNQLGFQFANGETIFTALNLKFDHTPTAIVGRNGVGKSVLARLIAGFWQPTSGSVTRAVATTYVAQTFVATAGETVAESTGSAAILQALERMNRGCGSVEDFDLIGEQWDLADRLRRLLDDAGLAEVAFTDHTGNLSGGQQARIALIGAFLSQAPLLILDEPTNHLDASGRQWLMNSLERWHTGLIVASHDRQLLDRMQRIVELSASGAIEFGGNYSAFREHQRIHHAAAQARLDHARSERQRERIRLQREHDTIQRHAANSRRNAETANIASFEYVAIKGAAREIMGHVRQGHQARKSELDAQVREAYAKVQPQDSVLINLPGSAVPNNRQICTLVDARLPWLSNGALSLTIHGPMRIAVSGPNGCGKSTLLKVLAGELAPVDGIATTHVPLAFLDQRLAQLDDQRSITEQLMMHGTALTEGTLRSYLANLQLDASRATGLCASLSGGERLKAALAMALWRSDPAQLLLLDEPTNHLDLPSVEAFERALQTFPGAIVAVSHDQDFLEALNPTHHLRWQQSGWQLHPTN
ncbi:MULTISPECIES: ABC-F family ATP-binding cassette domain-containing protein [unclassified Pseudomonas]|uniref:ABC-F family ATP-binding cassette domain-containing protein n=1 Tax=unclassified Pseudomonas TaxID=196821 RepID=UPI000A1D7BDD|nr:MULTISPECIES: ATP-binding cassette domain-containing protein [unclassified Pseudomonas]TFA86521.1 ATPase subunit of ABC transporter with duplicated ATPase domains [Pseudomonas sp. LAIL14HWK12:I2]